MKGAPDDPATRELIEKVYIRRVARLTGELVNKKSVEFAKVKVSGKGSKANQMINLYRCKSELIVAPL